MRIAVLLSLAFLGCASLLTATAAPPTLSSTTIEDASTVKPGAMPPMMPDLKTWKIKGKGGFTSTAAGTRVQVTVAVQRRHPVSNSNTQTNYYETVNPSGSSSGGRRFHLSLKC